LIPRNARIIIIINHVVTLIFKNPLLLSLYEDEDKDTLESLGIIADDVAPDNLEILFDTAEEVAPDSLEILFVNAFIVSEENLEIFDVTEDAKTLGLFIAGACVKLFIIFKNNILFRN